MEFCTHVIGHVELDSGDNILEGDEGDDASYIFHVVTDFIQFFFESHIVVDN